MSGLLTGVVVVLVVCHTPKTFLNIQVNIKELTKQSTANTPLNCSEKKIVKSSGEFLSY